jgi:serine/threonine protein phosphatase PrpC
MTISTPLAAHLLDFGPILDIAARSQPSISQLLTLENQDNLVLIDANGHALHLYDQDACHRRVPNWPQGHLRMAVLDGMGGHGQGRQVADAVAASLLQLPACRTLEQLSASLDLLHEKLQAQFASPGDQDSFRRPGTTLTLVEIPPNQSPLLYHVGDSRLYEISATSAQSLTIDHVPATSFALHGLLDEASWRQQVHREHRAHITQAFVLGNAFANPQQLDDGLHVLDSSNLPPFLRHLPDRRALVLRPDALYLLATDGLWACARPDQWTARWPALLADAEDAETALARLFAEFNQHPPRGQQLDNLTAIAFRVMQHDRNDNENMDETALPSFAPLSFG